MKCAVVAVLIALAVHGAGALLLAFLLQVASLNERMTPSELDFSSVDLSLSETDTEAPMQQREPLPALPPPGEAEPSPPEPLPPPTVSALETMPPEFALEQFAAPLEIDEPLAKLDLPAPPAMSDQPEAQTESVEPVTASAKALAELIEPPEEPLPERPEPIETPSESALAADELKSPSPSPVPDTPPPAPAPDQTRIETTAALKTMIDVRKIYPEESRLAREEGVVLLELSLTDRGSVVSAKVVRSSGYPALDAAALKAGRKAKFKPATVNGRPVATTVRLPLNFILH